MRAFPIIGLLSLAIRGGNCQCKQDSHEDVIERLYEVFTPAGAVCYSFTEGSVMPIIDRTTTRCAGINENLGYDAWAEYTHTMEDEDFTRFLLVGSRDWGPQPARLEATDFSTYCLNSFDDIFEYINAKPMSPLYPPNFPAAGPVIPPLTPNPTPAPNVLPPTQHPTVDETGVLTPPENASECTNSLDDFGYENANGVYVVTFCENIAKDRASNMKRLCQKYLPVAEACPGLCKKKVQCKCENNPWKFRLRFNRKASCSDLANDEEKRKRKCKKRKFKLHCPGICKKECMDTATSGKLVI